MLPCSTVQWWNIIRMFPFTHQKTSLKLLLYFLILDYWLYSTHLLDKCSTNLSPLGIYRKIKWNLSTYNFISCMVAPHLDDTIFSLLSDSVGDYSFLLFLSSDYVSHFRAKLSRMHCMRLEWRGGVAATARQPPTGNSPVKWIKVSRTATKMRHKQS